MRKISAYSRIAEFIGNLIISEGLSFEYKIYADIDKDGAEVKVIRSGFEEPEVVYHIYHSDILIDMNGVSTNALLFAQILQSAQKLADFTDFDVEQESLE